MLLDTRQRRINYLRVSVTDRCDFRCHYCMASDTTFLSRSEVLDLDETEHLCAAFIRLGVRKLRITGGEPLVRRGIMQLFASLHRHLGHGLDELALTTNGSQLAHFTDELVQHGVRRINVSLDTLDPDRFSAITRTGKLATVLRGIDAAAAAGLAVKINTVALKGVNEDEFDRLIEWCGERGFDITFIEAMPFGEGVAGMTDLFLSLREVKQRLMARWTLDADPYSSGGPARYWQVAETGRRIGFISPLTDHFCDSCNRVRLDCTGRLHLCLGADDHIDLKSLLRSGASPAELDSAIGAAMTRRPTGHKWLEMDGSLPRQRSLNALGG